MATGVRPWIAASVAMRLLLMATYVGQALLMAGVLAALLHGAGLHALGGRLIALGLVVAARFALIWGSELVAQATAGATKERLRGEIFTKIAALGPVYTGGARTGEMQAALVEGVEALEHYFSAYLPALIAAILTPTIAVLILATRDVWLALLVALFVLAAIVLPPLWQNRLASASRARRQAFIALSAEFLDTLQGMVTLKAFGASVQRRADLADRSDRLATRMIREMSVVLVRGGIYAFAVLGGMAAVAAVAAERTAHGLVAPATIFAALFLAREALRPISELAGAFHASYAARVAAEQIERLFAAQPPAADTGRVLVPVLRSTLEFDGVTFGYGTDGPVLRDLSLRVEAGETVAIVGPSGAGKTTVIALLLRFVDPQSGRVLLGGRDLRELPLDHVRSMISLVSQDTYLFAGSVRENLALARPGVADPEIQEAARAAGAHEFILALPDGYATQIGERGVRLSGGQRQRLAIARALLKNAPILALDEATASVDAATEASIQTALDRITKDRTTIVVAHRLSTVRHADRIVVLEDGRIVEMGRHEQLVTQAGTYARLIAAQAVS